MYGAEHLQAFGGLPAVDFQPKDDPADRPAADDVAWRISVEPYGDDDRDRPWEQEFADFLDAVDPAGVRALIIGQWGEAYDENSAVPIGLVIAAADRLTSLEAVFVGDLEAEQAEITWIEQSDVTALLAAFPALTEFGARGGTDLVFPPVKHDRLRALTIQAGGLPVQVVRGVLDSELPALERLDLWLGVSAYGGDTDVADLAPLLSGTRFPASTTWACATARCRTRSRPPSHRPRSSPSSRPSTCRTGRWATRVRPRSSKGSRSPISTRSISTTTSSARRWRSGSARPWSRTGCTSTCPSGTSPGTTGAPRAATPPFRSEVS